MSEINPFHKILSVSVLAAFITIGCLQFFFGLYFEDSIKIPPVLISGYISSPPIDAWFNESMLFQPPILSYLSMLLPNIPVFGALFFILQIVILTIWNFLSIRIFSRLYIQQPIFSLIIALLFAGFTIGTSLQYVHIDRVSLLLTGGCLLLYLDYYITENKQPISLLVLFIYGCTIRVSVAVLMFSFIAFLALILFRNLKKVIRVLWIPGFALSVMLGIVLINKYNSNNPAVEIESTYEYALFDRHAILPLSAMKSAEDSIRYEALTHYFLFTDSANIKLDFVKKVIDNDLFMQPKVQQTDLNHLTNVFLPFITQNYIFLIGSYLLLIVLSIGSTRKIFFSMVAIHLIGWLVLVIIAMKLTMYDKLFFPWITMLFGSSLVILNSEKVVFKKYVNFISILITTGLCYIVVMNISAISKSEIENNAKADRYIKNIEGVAQKQTPILWDNSFVGIKTGIFSLHDHQVYKKCLYPTVYFIMYFPFGQKRFIDKFGFSPLDWLKMGKVLKQNNEKVCFIVKDDFADFLKRYYKQLYNLNFILIKDVNSIEITPGHYVYHLQNLN